METNFDVVVIGGGASGMMSAIFASRKGKKTLILDHNEKLGKKLYITGKGKCNLTNNSSVETHLENIMHNSKFMYSALNAFTPQDTMAFFEENGLKLRTERGKRVFPESDKSSDVIKTLEKCLHRYEVKISLNNEILSVQKQGDLFHIKCDNGVEYTSYSLILATGGLSYTGTGASDFGCKIATQFGHKLIKAKSALCPIVLYDDVSSLNGLSLKNVSLELELNGKKFKEFGEMMFTFNSITGPIALTLSSKINEYQINKTKLILDLKPALTITQLDQKLKRESLEYAKTDLKNYLYTVLPHSFVDYFMHHTKLTNKKMADLSKIERNTIISNLKQFDFLIKSLDNINVSIVTAGGVDVKQINSKTCESKLVPNLYIVGELLDVDALTGGFNLQIAWSTGFVAGNSVR